LVINYIFSSKNILIQLILSVLQDIINPQILLSGMIEQKDIIFILEDLNI